MIFFNKARVTKNNGCYFYDQDIIALEYKYSGDTKIKLSLDYVNPGFGILLIKNEKDIFNSSKQYMFKLGNNDYSIIEKTVDNRVGSQNQLEYSTIQFQHLLKEDNTYLILEYINGYVFFYIEQNNKKVLDIVSNFKIELNEYKIAFYSQYGNTIKSIQVSSGLPVGWTPNSISTVGGRLYYYDNTIQFENCTYEAETETDYIELKAGTYYLKYTVTGDIKAYIFDSSSEKLEEKEKTLLKDGKIVLDKDSKISVKFRGKNGTVSNIFLQEYENGKYIPSSGAGSYQDGSYLIFDLENISKIELTIKITELPVSDTLKYYYFKYGDREFLPEDFPLNKFVDVVFIKDDMIIKYDNNAINLGKYTSKTLNMFYNVNGIISKLLITNIKGKTNNILNISEFVAHVTNELETPILCVNNDNEPLDLSSSYREIIIDNTQIDMFNKYCIMKLSKQLNVYDLENIEVVGIKDSCEINPDASTFKNFIISDTGFTYIDFNYKNNIDIKNNSLIIPEFIRSQYKYIAIKYSTADNFFYRFTNWSREYFDNSNLNLQLAHSILDTFNNIVLYGTNNQPNENTFFRVRDGKEITDIKMTVSNYDVLDNSAYEVDYIKNRIILNSLKYKYYIIEYLKSDSYCINDLKFNKLLNKDVSNLYEVKVSSNQENIKILYDQNNETKSINKYQITDISINPDHYIVLR